MIKNIKLNDFKNISNFESELTPLNILIGANNSGKSSVLQGIHFSIMSEVIRRKIKKSNLSEDLLLYIPSSNFLYLRHDQPYTVSSGFTSSLYLEDECGENFLIEISKGRNDRNISVDATGNSPFRQSVTNFSPLYCMYVPGISGIPIREKFIAKAELRSAVARGDANMYIRNILYYIQIDKKLDLFNDKIHQIFPDVTIEIPYNPDEDLYVQINIMIKTANSARVSVPLEQCGTGMLQVIQIIAYTLYFSPKLLLLDEPDEHLHPDNQLLLAELLKEMAFVQDIQIILCTHSRHLLSSLSDDSNIIWLKEGTIFEKNAASRKYDILLDIGALDTFDKCIGGQYKCVFLTEDKDTKMIDLLLNFNGFKDTLVFPFNGCGNTETAILLANFIHQQVPDCLIIIHRDRDFMFENEVEFIKSKIKIDNIIPFITDGSDIEAYFTNINHISELLKKEATEIKDWIDELINKNLINIIADFIHKRDELKNLPIYKKEGAKDTWVSAAKILQTENITHEKVKGKFLKKKISGDMQRKFSESLNIIQESKYLKISSLQELSKLI